MEKLYANPWGDNNPKGFTNKFLEERSRAHFFDQKYSDFKLSEATQGRPSTYHKEILKASVERSPLSDAFFSDANINYLKKTICKEIERHSKGKYVLTPESQNTEPLVTVMMTMFFDHGLFQPTNISGQVNDLNKKVIDDFLPRTMDHIKHHLAFIRDHSRPYMPMARPVHVSTAGSRTNPSYLR